MYNHMQLPGWDLPVNLVFRIFFSHVAGTEPRLGACYLRMQLRAAQPQSQGPSGPRCSSSTSASCPPLFTFLAASLGVLLGAEHRVQGFQSWLLARSNGEMRKLKESLSHAL